MASQNGVTLQSLAANAIGRVNEMKQKQANEFAQPVAFGNHSAGLVSPASDRATYSAVMEQRGALNKANFVDEQLQGSNIAQYGQQLAQYGYQWIMEALSAAKQMTGTPGVKMASVSNDEWMQKVANTGLFKAYAPTPEAFIAIMEDTLEKVANLVPAALVEMHNNGLIPSNIAEKIEI